MERENQVFDCLCGHGSCPKPGGSGDQQSTILTSERDLSATRSSRQSDATMKAFTSFLINAWRQRREEVRGLKQVVDRLKNSSMRTKNEVHILNTVMRGEQNRNSDLKLELKQSRLNFEKARTSCKRLTSSVQSLTAEKNQLHLDLEKIRKELNEVEEISSQTNSEALSKQHSLQSQLSEEQRARHQLQHEKEELQKEVDSKKAKYEKAQEFYEQDLAEMMANIQGLRKALEEKHLTGREQAAELHMIKAQITKICHKNSRSNLGFCSSITRLNICPQISREVSFMRSIPIWQNFHQFPIYMIYLFSAYLRPAVHLGRHRFI